jgi:serine phosphatase RsbU (regulator of sigma subunit)
VKSLGIATRLSLAFFLMVGFTTTVGVLGLMRMQDLNATLEVITNDRFEKLAIARRGLELIEENARLAMLIFVGNSGNLDELVATQKNRSAEISKLYAEFETKITAADEREAFDRVKSRRLAYVAPRAKLENLLTINRAQATAGFQREVLPNLLAYIKAWDELVELEGNRVKESVRSAESEYARARLTTMIFVAIAGALGALVAWFVTRRIAQPLRAVARAAQLLEKNGSTERLPVRSHDEIGTLTRAFNLMSEAVTFRQERLEREMNIAQGIQTALLPRSLAVPCLEVAASMRPANEVGGDYYDVLPAPDGCWIGIGDVAGHGLESGLLMLMIQSSVMTLVRTDPDAAPRSVICGVNRTINENLRERLDTTSFATLMLMRYRTDGSFVFAGAHEEIVVWRAATKRCEIVPTPGTWVGGVRNIESTTVDSRLRLAEGDLMVLFTDGVIEARNSDGEVFDSTRLCNCIEETADQPVERIRERVFAEVTGWERQIEDDATLLVIRRTAARA